MNFGSLSPISLLRLTRDSAARGMTICPLDEWLSRDTDLI